MLCNRTWLFISAVWIYTCILELLYAHTAPRPAPVFIATSAQFPLTYQNHFSFSFHFWLINLCFEMVSWQRNYNKDWGLHLWPNWLIGVNFSKDLRKVRSQRKRPIAIKYELKPGKLAFDEVLLFNIFMWIIFLNYILIYCSILFPEGIRIPMMHCLHRESYAHMLVYIMLNI